MRVSAQPVAVITILLPSHLHHQKDRPIAETPSACYVHGATVSSFTTVSLEPPLIAFSLQTPSRLADALQHPSISKRPHFIVNVLSESQGREASEFAKPGLQPLKLRSDWSDSTRLLGSDSARHPLAETHFFPSSIATDDEGVCVPVLSDSLGSLACSLVSKLDLRSVHSDDEVAKDGLDAGQGGGGSVLFLARVHGVEDGGRKGVDEEEGGSLPMVYWNRQFTTIVR
jgi:flavin reductase (DIM6/NTAB) family NADH-FMN oxidoreductase RutF